LCFGLIRWVIIFIENYQAPRSVFPLINSGRGEEENIPEIQKQFPGSEMRLFVGYNPQEDDEL